MTGSGADVLAAAAVSVPLAALAGRRWAVPGALAGLVGFVVLLAAGAAPEIGAFAPDPLALAAAAGTLLLAALLSEQAPDRAVILGPVAAAICFGAGLVEAPDLGSGPATVLVVGAALLAAAACQGPDVARLLVPVLLFAGLRGAAELPDPAAALGLALAALAAVLVAPGRIPGRGRIVSAEAAALASAALAVAAGPVPAARPGGALLAAAAVLVVPFRGLPLPGTTTASAPPAAPSGDDWTTLVRGGAPAGSTASAAGDWMPLVSGGAPAGSTASAAGDLSFLTASASPEPAGSTASTAGDWTTLVSGTAPAGSTASTAGDFSFPTASARIAWPLAAAAPGAALVAAALADMPSPGAPGVAVHLGFAALLLAATYGVLMHGLRREASPVSSPAVAAVAVLVVWLAVAPGSWTWAVIGPDLLDAWDRAAAVAAAAALAAGVALAVRRERSAPVARAKGGHPAG